jgi:hypothetical protein
MSGPVAMRLVRLLVGEISAWLVGFLNLETQLKVGVFDHVDL